ncbi:MAG: vWA domain-containing protein [Eubacteriales bacterium]
MKQANNNLTELVFVIDKSGSMEGLEKDTIGGFNAMLKEQQAEVGEAYVTTVLFSSNYTLLHDRINIKGVEPLTENDYQVGGGTALLDAVGMAMHKIRKVQKQTAAEYQADNVLFVIITDGEENSSRQYTAERVKKRIARQQEKYGWKFMFFGANMDAVQEAENIGIDAKLAISYSADSVGTASSFNQMSQVSSAVRSGSFSDFI